MTNEPRFKVCMNCSAFAGLLRRKCQGCGARKAIFRKPTDEEISRRDQKIKQLNATLQSLLKPEPMPCG